MHINNLLMLIIIFIYGICFGSFASVLIYRIPNNIYFIKGRSFCPHCKSKLKCIDLIPLYSFIKNKSTCKYCGVKIDNQYIIVELLSGIIFTMIYIKYGFNLLSVLYSLISIIIIVIGYIDYNTFNVYDNTIFILFVICLGVLVISDINIVNHLLSGFILSLPLYIITKLYQDSLGFGDIEIIFCLGVLFGFNQGFLLFFISLVFGCFYGFYILYKNHNSSRHFAFGPCICCAYFVVLFFGNNIVDYYFNLFI